MAMRSPKGGNGKPKLWCSSSYQPAPSPSSTRPPEMWSTVVAAFASSEGWRKVTGDTIVPSRMRELRAAIAASVVQASWEPRPIWPSPDR